MAKEIIPVSSDTIITSASDISDNPIAALCLVPNFLLISLLLVNGKTHPDANILSLPIIVAPSWSGVFTTNIFSSRFDVIFASNMVPEAIIYPSPVPCSIAISAPVFVSAKLDTALTISLT